MRIQNKLQSIIHRLVRHHSHRSYKSVVMHPQRDWVLGLVTTIMLLLGVGFIGWQLFTTANSTPELTDEEVDTAVAYRQTLVERALTEYREVAAEYEIALNNRGSVPTQEAVDPVESAAPVSEDPVATSTLDTTESTSTPEVDTPLDTAADPPAPSEAVSQEVPTLAN